MKWMDLEVTRLVSAYGSEMGGNIDKAGNSEHVRVMKETSFQLRARVPERRYRNAEKILNRLGMNPGDAVNLFLAQIELHQGLPFEVTLEPAGLLGRRQQANAWEEAFGEY